jgi:hypothetical protein
MTINKIVVNLCNALDDYESMRGYAFGGNIHALFILAKLRCYHEKACTYLEILSSLSNIYSPPSMYVIWSDYRNIFLKGLALLLASIAFIDIATTTIITLSRHIHISTQKLNWMCLKIKRARFFSSQISVNFQTLKMQSSPRKFYLWSCST